MGWLVHEIQIHEHRFEEFERGSVLPKKDIFYAFEKLKNDVPNLAIEIKDLKERSQFLSTEILDKLEIAGANMSAITESIDRSTLQKQESDTEPELCYCKNPLNHPWAFNSQCIKPETESESETTPKLTEADEKQTYREKDSLGIDEDSLGIDEDSWGIDRLPPSWVKLYIVTQASAACIECKSKEKNISKLEAELEKLKARNQKLKRENKKLVSLLQEQMDIYWVYFPHHQPFKIKMSTITTITNQELITKIQSEGKSKAACYLLDICMKNLPACSPTQRACLHTVDKIMKKRSEYLKSKKNPLKGQEFQLFLESNVKLPQGNVNLQHPKAKITNDLCDCHDCSYKSVSEKLASECKTHCANEERLQSELLETQEELRKLRRSRLSKEKVKAILQEIKLVKSYNKTLEKRIKLKNTELKRVRQSNVRLRSKLSKLERKNQQLLQNQNEVEEKVESYKCEVKQLNEINKTTRDNLDSSLVENEWLRDIVETDSETVMCYDNNENKYSYELRQCIYGLLSCNVSSRHIPTVIKTVLSMVNKIPNKLPARSTILDMNIERLILSQAQLAEIVPDKENMTLYTDETSKFGVKYTGYHVSDMEGNMFCMGLRELQTKSASDTLYTFQQIIGDIQDQSISCNNNTSKKILVNIVATMSDRASTEIKFNELLQDLREQILPDVIENWTVLSREDQESISQLLNFFFVACIVWFILLKLPVNL